MSLRLGNKKVCPTKLVKVNNVDWSKIGLNLHSYNTSGNKTDIIDGKLWRNGSGFFPRATADETGTTKFVNFSQPFEIHAKFSAPTEDLTRPSCIFGNGYDNQWCRSPECTYTSQDANNTLWFGLSTDGQNWTYTQSFTPSEVPKSTTGEVYEVTSKYTGSEWIVSVTFNGETLTKSLTITGTPYYSSNNSSDGSYLCIANNAGSTSMALHGGYIYLDNTYIKQNDILVWGCEAGQNYIEVDPNNYLISNVTKVGAIEDDKGVLSGFTSSSTYAYMLQVGNLSEGSEVNIGFIMPTSLSGGDVPVIAGKNNSSWTGDIFLDDSTSKFSSWDNSTVWTGQTTLIGNHEYSFKLVKNSSGKLDAYLKEGNTTSNINDYTLEFSGAVDFLSGSKLYLGRWDYQYFNGGSINLNNCSIKIDGQTSWQGVVPQGARG